METAKANILQALIKEYDNQDKMFYDFKLELQEKTPEYRTVLSLVYAFIAWRNNQQRINESFKDIVREATRSQQKIKECKEVSIGSLCPKELTDEIAKSKEIENGIYQLCYVIGFSPTITKELFIKVTSFINFDSFI
jgi:hypothetical protein